MEQFQLQTEEPLNIMLKSHFLENYVLECLIHLHLFFQEKQKKTGNNEKKKVIQKIKETLK